MKYFIKVIMLSILLTSNAFAKVENTKNPYTQSSEERESIEKYKVEVGAIILMDSNEKLSKNVDPKEMAEYTVNLMKLGLEILNDISVSNEFRLDVVVSKYGSSARIGMRKEVNILDEKTLKYLHKRIIEVETFNTEEEISFQIQFNVNADLPKEQKF